MSQKAKTGEKKGAKSTSHVDQSVRSSSIPAEESKASALVKDTKLANNKRLRKNLGEKVAA